MSARRMGTAAALLGFSLGGFFDGIVLHQILQWHHVLSAVRADAWATVEAQILADGLFHAAMYLIGLLGLYLLVSRHGSVYAQRTWGTFLPMFLVGFGVWHAVDAVLMHWLLGLHRVRMDVPEPLWWDLGWLAVFGGLPLLLAHFMWRRRQYRGFAGSALTGWVVALTVGAGVAAGWPRASDTATVILRPDISAAQWLQALPAHDARIVGSDPRQRVWVVKLAPQASRHALYRHGALLVSGTMLPAGCANFAPQVALKQAASAPQNN